MENEAWTGKAAPAKILHSSFFILHLIALSLHNKMLQWYYDSLKGKKVRVLYSPAAVFHLFMYDI